MAYEWAVSKIKLERALKRLPKDADEEEVKKHYILLGGAVLPVDDVVTTAPLPKPIPEPVTEPEVKAEAVKPRRGRPKKNV